MYSKTQLLSASTWFLHHITKAVAHVAVVHVAVKLSVAGHYSAETCSWTLMNTSGIRAKLYIGTYRTIHDLIKRKRSNLRTRTIGHSLALDESLHQNFLWSIYLHFALGISAMILWINQYFNFRIVHHALTVLNA